MHPVHNSPELLQIGDLIFSSSFVPSIIFLVYYIWPKSGAQWWKTPVGRMFVISQFSLILVSVAVIMSLTFGQDYPGRDVLRIVAYSLHACAQWIVLIVYYRVRHEHDSGLQRRDDKKAPTAER
jgi:hypothetical protein